MNTLITPLIFALALALMPTLSQAGYTFDNSSDVTVSSVYVSDETVNGAEVQFKEHEKTFNKVSGMQWEYTEWGKINCKTYIYQDGGDGEQPDWGRYDSQDITSTKYKKIATYVCSLPQ